MALKFVLSQRRYLLQGSAYLKIVHNRHLFIDSVQHICICIEIHHHLFLLTLFSCFTSSGNNYRWCLQSLTSILVTFTMHCSVVQLYGAPH